MTAEKFKRKLTAILSADVKGYSGLMGEDEEGTIRTLTAGSMSTIRPFRRRKRPSPSTPIPLMPTLC